ncbi:MAG: hypothetical protein DA405_11475 [Bacteroidetes bacterium]|nr:MAG: hypothetical protein DA405_11475 [Bacteroidota bacterium]
MNVLIVEDHPIIALGYEILLKRNFSKCSAKNVTNGSDTMLELSAVEYDLIILDIILPETDTHALIHQIRAFSSELPVLIISSCNEQIYARSYLSAGINGYLPKSSSDSNFILAVNMVLKGHIFISKNVFGYDFNNSSDSNPFGVLSKRELEVLKHLLNGLGINAISTLMKLTASTIATQKSRILDKLNVNNMLDVYQLANEYGLLNNGNSKKDKERLET